MKLTFVTLAIFLATLVSAQEINCSFTLNHSQIQGTNKQIFETLEKTLIEFVNNRVWTNHYFEPYERIECNMLLTIDTWEGDNFTGSLQVQARRPVFNSSYNTVMLNIIDEEVDFEYQEFDPLEFSDNTFTHNLTSIIAFYTYIILGIDYDSFAELGGTPFFEKAEQVVDNAQNAGF